LRQSGIGGYSGPVGTPVGDLLRAAFKANLTLDAVWSSQTTSAKSNPDNKVNATTQTGNNITTQTGNVIGWASQANQPRIQPVVIAATAIIEIMPHHRSFQILPTCLGFQNQMKSTTAIAVMTATYDHCPSFMCQSIAELSATTVAAHLFAYCTCRDCTPVGLPLTFIGAMRGRMAKHR
jgi:hypothetical protein